MRRPGIGVRIPEVRIENDIGIILIPNNLYWKNHV
jgi:hypothetical protein